MHIGIDAYSLVGFLYGCRYYPLNLINAIANIDKKNQYTLYACFWRNYQSRKKKLELLCPSQNNFSLHTLYFPKIAVALLENKLKLPIQYWFLKSKNIDVFHGISFLPLIKKDIKTILTIYDLEFEINPNWKESRWYEGEVRDSAERADYIITISESTKKDLIKYYGISKNKIDVIYCGVSPNFGILKEKENFESIRKKYGLPEKFILFVGAPRRRKNLPRMIRAFAEVKKKNQCKEKFVIVGGKVHSSNEVFQIVKELNIEKDVIFTGYVPDEDLLYFYNLASAFVFTTLYEGFGLVVLEAMACGTPVITSNISSLPEVAGDSALLVDPYNEEKICLALEKVLYDEELRNKLIEKGLKRVKYFSWEKTAKETLSVYKKAYES